MNTFELKITDSALASRTSAANLRRTLLDTLKTHQRVKLDLSAVFSISDSYADELFGILALQLGLEKLLTHVKISGASSELMKVIATNIKVRVKPSIAAA